jgi:cell division septation protein DedD
MGRLYPTVD